MQGLVALAIAVILVLAGLYVPGSPVAQERADYDTAGSDADEVEPGSDPIAGLQAALWRIEAADDALNKQLDTLKTIVPEEKEVDEFYPPGAGSGGFFQRAIAEADVTTDSAEGIPLRDAV